MVKISLKIYICQIIRYGESTTASLQPMDYGLARTRGELQLPREAHPISTSLQLHFLIEIKTLHPAQPRPCGNTRRAKIVIQEQLRKTTTRGGEGGQVELGHEATSIFLNWKPPAIMSDIINFN
jgi:hypothetical protein